MTGKTSPISIENATDEQPADERSTKFWFNDGNIVLKVETMLYRVHASTLARHSKVFEDMVSFPQPLNEQNSLLCGCPVLELSDRANDFELILSIFYDNLK